MPDAKITALPGGEMTTPAFGDLLPIIDDPAGVPLSQRIKLENLHKLPAGTATIAPTQFTSGTILTTPVAGAEEYDGASFFRTIDTTSGRGGVAVEQYFRLNATGAAFGPAITNFFGTNSAFPTVAGATYEITYYLYYTKTTAGTATYTLTNSGTYTNAHAYYQQSAVGGVTPNAGMTTAAVLSSSTAALALPATGSLTTAVNHFAVIKLMCIIGTAGNIRCNVTQSAGTITPYRSSYYIARRLSNNNVGTFVA